MSADEQALASGTVVLTKADGGKVHLLGTSHCSEESTAHAESLVRLYRPSAVVLELCSSRWNGGMERAAPAQASEEAAAARSSTAAARSSTRESTGESRASPARSSAAAVASTASSVLADWTQAIALQYAAFERLGMSRSGSEFGAAASAAREVGAEVVLADREIGVTRLRLQRMVPMSEMVLDALGLDVDVWQQEAREHIRRMESADALADAAKELREAVGRGASTGAPPSDVEQLARHVAAAAADAQSAAVPDYLAAVLLEMFKRFWCYEVIDATLRAKLQRALNALHRVDFDEFPMSRTVRRVLLDERDAVLTHALRTCPGEVVVGVVGKAHVRGIQRLWAEDDLDAAVAEATREPPRSLAPLAAAVGTPAVLAYGAYRSRVLRYALAVGAGAACAGAGWLTLALSRRMAFFNESQERERMRAASAAEG